MWDWLYLINKTTYVMYLVLSSSGHMTKTVCGCPDTGSGSTYPLAHLTQLSLTLIAKIEMFDNVTDSLCSCSWSTFTVAPSLLCDVGQSLTSKSKKEGDRKRDGEGEHDSKRRRRRRWRGGGRRIPNIRSFFPALIIFQKHFSFLA